MMKRIRRMKRMLKTAEDRCMKALEKKINMIDVNMNLQELFKNTFGEPIIDVN